MKKMNLILSGSLLVMSLGVLSPAVVYAGAETETAQEDENGEMSLELNLKAAQDFPPTYVETSKSGKGLHLVMEILMKVYVFSISRVSETLRSYSAETRRMSFLRESRMKCWINVRHILRMMIHSVDISH